jgi:hypothetical protein
MQQRVAPFAQRTARTGACGKTRVVQQNRGPRPEPAEHGGLQVHVLLSTYDSRGDVEPPRGVAVRGALAAAGVTSVGMWR